MNLSRRTFIVSAALAPVACGVPLGYEHGTPVAQPNPIPKVRPPQVGQEWTYIKRNIFDGKTIGLVTERVASVGSTITIQRLIDSGVQLPNEIQGPWGMVQTDPQWNGRIKADEFWPLRVSLHHTPRSLNFIWKLNPAIH